jgi:Uma2 family endonuclease
MTTATLPVPDIEYPSSDGKRMVENTRQAYWIILLATGLAAMLHEVAEVFIATGLLWYPVEGHSAVVTAPDVLVAFDRPRGHRLSYRQWEEGGVPPQVVFEVLTSPWGYQEMADKLAFYDEHGVEEYYVYDPDHNTLDAYLRGQAALVRQRVRDTFSSPRLGIRFDLTGPEMAVFRPDGRRFLSPEEAEAERRRIAELVGKLLAGSASPEEVEELKRLQAAG